MGIARIREIMPTDVNFGFYDVLKVINTSSINNMNITQMICSKNIYVYVAEGGFGHILGTATLLLNKKFGGMIGLIEDVAVLPSVQRIGIGSELIKYILNEAKKLGCYKVILTTPNKYISFYKYCGMEVYQNCMVKKF
ncbi:hypothetical protein LCGC14_1094450 [marine sediment metagenome]|uniref:N-acetyltransferase domain-containing protein n=1 Tax=marine sediment metagenome TaxID=412755 RepID=A0A0F9PUG5_9ZZZZ